MYSLHFDLLLKVFLFSHHYIDAFYMQGSDPLIFDKGSESLSQGLTC